MRLFLIFVILSAYSYVIFPGLLLILSRILRRDWTRQEMFPSVSVIISAYNEEGVIEQKVQNALALEYPEDRLEVLVSSDGSTDRTEAIVRTCEGKNVRLIRQEPRVGKTACLNKAVPEAKGEIVVFTDANSMFPPDLLLHTVRNFADQDIGLVTGWTKYRKPGGGEERTGVYAEFEKWCKFHESMIFSCVGADGAVFAIRKALYKPLKDYDINDFVTPLDVIRQGKRVVLDPEVFCFEDASGGLGKEYSRQVRITTRTLGAIRRNLEVLNPLRYGSFSFLLFSHKVMRFLVPFFVLGAFFSNLLLLGRNSFFIVTFVGQATLLGWALSSVLFGLDGRVSGILKFFLTTSTAQGAGWIRAMLGVKDTIWKPQR